MARHGYRVLVMLCMSICLPLNVLYGQECNLALCASIDCGLLNASFSSDGGPVFCEGETIFLENNSDPGFDYFVIDWNDGNIDTVTTYNDLSHTYLVDDTLACKDDIIPFSLCFVGVKECSEGISCQRGSFDFALKLKPRAKWSVQQAPCAGNAMDFMDLSCHTNTESTFLWDFGDGTTSNAQNPSHTYASPGVYIVSLTVTNDCGSDIQTRAIEVFDYPVAEIDLDGSGSVGGEGCAPFTQWIALNSNGWVQNLSWSIFPDSTGGAWIMTDTNATLTDTAFEVIFNQPGTYTVNLEYWNACETRDTTTTITVYAPINYTFSPPQAGCDISTVCFDDLGMSYSGDISGFQWTFVNGDIPSYFDATNPDFGCVTFNENGSITLEVLGPCPENVPQTVPVAVINTTAVSIEADLNDPICQDEGPIYLEPSTPGGVYFWNNDPAGFIVNDTLYPEDLSSQDYEITYVVGMASPCPVDTTFTFEIAEAVTASLLPEGPFCDFAIISPSLNLTGMVNQVSWQVTGDTMITDNTMAPEFSLDAGAYTIAVAVSGECGSGVDTIDVIIQADVPASISPVADPYCTSQGQSVLEAFPPGGTWSGPGILNASTGLFDPGVAGPGNVTLTYNISNGPCSSQDAITFEVVASELSVQADISLCQSGEIFTFAPAQPAGGTWAGEGILNATEGSIDLGLLQADTSYVFTYCVDPSAVNCDPCATTIIHIEPLPEAGFTFEGQPCQGDAFAFTNTSQGAADYAWSFGDGEISGSANPQHTFNASGNFDVTLVATSPAGCIDSVSYQVHVVAPPVIDVLFSGQEGCAPLEVEYMNNSFGEGISQYWVIGTRDTLFEDQPVIILDSVLTDSLITVELIVENGCRTFSESADFFVHPYPIVDFGINDDEGCSPDTVWFVNASVGNPDALVWDFGNNHTYVGFNPPYQVYASPDDSISTYTISLYGENACGTDTMEKRIKVFPNNVNPFFEIDTLGGCPPLAINLTSYTTPGATITYDFGNGDTGTTGDTSYTYVNPGKYVITQYAQLCGIDSVKSDSIHVYPVPEVAFTHTASVCARDTIRFENLSDPGLASFWDFGDGGTSSAFEPVHVFADPGTYVVRLTQSSDFYDCPITDTSTIVVRENPVVAFMPGTDNACPGEEIAFIVTGDEDVFYAWDFGDNAGDTTRNPIHAFSRPGEYTVSLTVFDAFGCSSEPSVATVTIFEQPATAFDLTATEHCAGGGDISTINQSTGFVSSQWFLDGQMINTQDDDIVIPDPSPGDYTLRLVSTNAFGCVDSMTRTFTVYPQPVADFSLPDNALCEGDTTFVIDLSEDATGYSWMINGSEVNFNNNSLSFDLAGEYQLSLIASHAGICFDTFVYPVMVRVYDSPEAGFTYAADVDPSVLGDVDFFNLSTDADTYLWDFGDGRSSSEENPTHEYDINGPVAVILTATAMHDGIVCQDRATALVDFERLNRFFAPNAMSPDKNFGNDLVSVFKPTGIGVAAYELTIYSPWGDIVATLNQVVDEAPADAWDGTYKGEVVPQGVYLWKARVEYTDGDVEMKAGNVTVVR